jgi:hypothetical protein
MLLDDLSRAVRGNYGIILSLLGCLDHGPFVKKVVDAVIDSCMLISFLLNTLMLMAQQAIMF